MKNIIKATILCIGLVSSLPVTAMSVINMQYQSVDLNDVVGDGRWTLIMIWATDCSPCEKQKPMIQEFHNAHVDTNAQVIGIAADGMRMFDEVSNIIDKQKTTYPNYIVDARTFYKEYAAWTKKDFRATPTYVLIDPNGVMKGVAVGPISRDTLEEIVNR